MLDLLGKIWLESRSFLFFRVPVVVSTAVVVAGGNKILSEAKKRDFFFIIPCFINDVSVLSIYDHIVVIEEFPHSKVPFDILNILIALFYFHCFSLENIKFFDRPCEITIQNILLVSCLLKCKYSLKKNSLQVGKRSWFYQRTNKKFGIQKGFATFSTTPQNMEENHETH